MFNLLLSNQLKRKNWGIVNISWVNTSLISLFSLNFLPISYEISSKNPLYFYNLKSMVPLLRMMVLDDLAELNSEKKLVEFLSKF